MSISGVILAAGTSRRMGRSKALLPWRGLPLLGWVIANARRSRLDDLVVVLGHQADMVRRQVDFQGATVVTNREYRRGQSSSLQAGLQAVPAGCTAVLFLLADQPLVDAAIIDPLLDAFHRQPASLILPVHQGRRGNPVLVARALFPQVHSLSGDTGLRPLFPALQGQLREVAVPGPAIHLDLDTLEEYRQLAAVWSAADPPLQGN